MSEPVSEGQVIRSLEPELISTLAFRSGLRRFRSRLVVVTHPAWDGEKQMQEERALP